MYTMLETRIITAFFEFRKMLVNGKEEKEIVCKKNVIK